MPWKFCRRSCHGMPRHVAKNDNNVHGPSSGKKEYMARGEFGQKGVYGDNRCDGLADQEKAAVGVVHSTAEEWQNLKATVEHDNQQQLLAAAAAAAASRSNVTTIITTSGSGSTTTTSSSSSSST
ncbi:MAG: hypothetical protein ABJP39_00005, partial [Marinobacter alexandrii]|uniref:hypothetical protein n=1 Tax=Marinobacter alexandrii TaxID=2570351 RepID=UPI003297D9E8